jgi:membrane protein required for beta-lactamase induction
VLGVEKVDQVLDAMYPPEEYDPKAWASLTPEDKQKAAAEMADKLGAATGKDSREALTEIAERLHEAISGE